MQNSLSYLRKPKKTARKKQAYLRKIEVSQRKPPPIREPEVGRQNGSMIDHSIACKKVKPAKRARSSSKSRMAIRTFYKWSLRALLLCTVIVMAGLIFFVRAPTAHPATIKEFAPPLSATAKGAYVAAKPVALRWADDSLLISLAASWDSGQDYHDGEGDWSLLFYSPSKESTALVSVLAGQAALINTHGVANTPSSQPVDLWLIDSPTVIERLKANGGEDFLRSQPESGLELSLNLTGEGTWKARLIDQKSRRMLTVQIGIEAGKLIAVEQTS